MNWKINNLTLTNFKFFLNKEDIKLEGKHLLLYGENGAGKSSIFWALYTLFQSCLKEQTLDGAGKYFSSKKQENLRNRFSQENDYSGIQVEFVNVVHQTRTFEISNRVLNTKVQGQIFMPCTLCTSDFLTYKYLSSVFDFKNSESIRLFDIFDREVFPFVDFDRSFIKLDGQDSLLTNAKEWWNSITQDSRNLPTRNDRPNTIRRGSIEYNRYVDRIRIYNEELNSFVVQLRDLTNDKLEHVFELPIKINLNLNRTEFDRIVPGNAHRSHRDSRLYKPEIAMTAEMVHPALTGGISSIEHPHTFFNEAKMTCVALALRLAVLEMKQMPTADCARILCIDDLLISLDMGNRLKIVDILLAYQSQFQMIIMTHDKSFYELILSKLGDNSPNWICKHLYAKDELFCDSGITIPILCDDDTYMGHAMDCYKRCDIPACANYLRKEAERLVKSLYPQSVLYKQGTGNLYQKKSLGELLNWLPHFYKKYNLPNLTPNINYFRKCVLNPLSHDDWSSPIYRNELKICIKELQIIGLLKKNDIAIGAQLMRDSFEMRIDNGASTFTIRFQVRETWSSLRDSANSYYSDVNMCITSTSDANVVPNGNNTLFHAHKLICTHLGYAPDSFPNIEDVVTRVADGMQLKDL